MKMRLALVSLLSGVTCLMKDRQTTFNYSILQVEEFEAVDVDSFVHSRMKSQSPATCLDVPLGKEVDFMMTDVEYLPSTIASKCQPSENAALIKAQLQYLGSNNCTLNRAMSPRVIEFGFGATIASLLKPMMHAIKYGYCLRSPKGLIQYSFEGGDNWGDFFQDWGLHSLRFNHIYKNESTLDDYPWKTETAIEGGYDSAEQMWEDWRQLLAAEESEMVDTGVEMEMKEDESQCAPWFEIQTWTYGSTSDGFGLPLQEKCDRMYSFKEKGLDVLADRFKEKGFFFTVAHLSNFIMRPNEVLQTEMKEAMEDMAWPENEKIIGLHFRRGDSCLEEHQSHGRMCEPFSKYMEHVKRLGTKYNIKHVFLATDDNNILKTLKDDYPQFIFHYNSNVGRGGARNEMEIEDALKYGKINGGEEAKAVIQDVHMLSKTDAFVGKFSSNIDRLAFQLNFAETGNYMPYISMDAAWCFDFAKLSGDHDGKPFFC